MRQAKWNWFRSLGGLHTVAVVPRQALFSAFSIVPDLRGERSRDRTESDSHALLASTKGCPKWPFFDVRAESGGQPERASHRAHLAILC